MVYVIFLGFLYDKPQFLSFYRALRGTGTAVGAPIVVVLVSGLDACVIGLITPPVGVALYGVAMVSRLPIERVFWATLPFFAILLALLAVMIAVPQIVTYLPSLLMAR